MADESGYVMCKWPDGRGRKKPPRPFEMRALKNAASDPDGVFRLDGPAVTRLLIAAGWAERRNYLIEGRVPSRHTVITEAGRKLASEEEE